MNSYVIGPSHVVRMQHAFNSRCLLLKNHELCFLGMGGAPTWGDVLFNKMHSFTDSDKRIYLVLGDYRFGNNILADGKDISEQDKVYINIHAEFISFDNDKVMYSYYRRGVDKWLSLYPGLTVIPWTLLMRRAENIHSQHHINDRGQYVHPVIDEKKMIEQYCSSSYVKCLEIPASILNFFYIDTDLHPSTLGYMFLTKCILGQDPYENIFSSVSELEYHISDFLIKLDIKRKIIISGDSVSFPTLKKVLPVEHCFRDSISFHNNSSDDEIEIFLTSLDSMEEARFISSVDGDKKNFPWDYLGFKTISKRHPDLERLNPNKESPSMCKSLEYYDLFNSDELFDIGEKLTPTIKGILFILSLASNKSSFDKINIINETIENIYSFQSSMRSKMGKPLIENDRKRIILSNFFNKIKSFIG